MKNPNIPIRSIIIMVLCVVIASKSQHPVAIGLWSLHALLWFVVFVFDMYEDQ